MLGELWELSSVCGKLCFVSMFLAICAWTLQRRACHTAEAKVSCQEAQKRSKSQTQTSVLRIFGNPKDFGSEQNHPQTADWVPV